MKEQSKLSSFVSELRRRKVFRVAAYYGGIAFVIVQIIDGTFDVMGIPVWISRITIIALSLGFPISLGFAWVFDITDEGIIRTKNLPISRAEINFHRAAISLIVFAGISSIIYLAGFGPLRLPGAADHQSVAVMPFRNLDATDQHDYFTDGITEEIIARLTHYPELRVIARTSIMQYKGTVKSASIIGDELGVSVILEGSVRRSNGRIRIIGQLIDVESEENMWTETFDREVGVDKIFDLQDEVARSIASALIAELDDRRDGESNHTPTSSLAAYELYLRAKHHLGERSTEALKTAIIELRAAIDADSLFAEAYAELGNAQNLVPYYLAGDESQLPEDTRAVIDRALALDPTSVAAHTARAVYEHFHRWNMVAASLWYKKAIALDPTYVPARHWYGIFLADAGNDLVGSQSEFEAALKLDPQSPILYTNLGDVFAEYDHFDAAEDYYWNALDIDPYFTGALYGLGMVYMQSGRYEDAESVFTNIVSLDLGWSLVALGRENEAAGYLGSWQTSVEMDLVNSLDLMATYASLGIVDSVRAIMERAYERRSPYFIFWRRQLRRAGLDQTDPLYRKISEARQLSS